MFLEISRNSHENTCARVSFLTKLQACNFIKNRLQHRCFPVNIAKFLRTPFFNRTPPVFILFATAFRFNIIKEICLVLCILSKVHKNDIYPSSLPLSFCKTILWLLESLSIKSYFLEVVTTTIWVFVISIISYLNVRFQRKATDHSRKC